MARRDAALEGDAAQCWLGVEVPGDYRLGDTIRHNADEDGRDGERYHMDSHGSEGHGDKRKGNAGGAQHGGARLD